MFKVACIMMQRDETLLLEPWLCYHGYLFGFENLYVFDNGSTDPGVLSTIARFARVGVNVDYSKSASADFDRKGEVIGSLIKSFKQSSKYDVVFPIDCDEFIAVSGKSGFSIRQEEIKNEISRFLIPGSFVKIMHCLDNRPGYLDLFRLTSYAKSVVLVSDFMSIDHGFHEARSLASDTYATSNLIYIHLHFKPFVLVKKHAIDKLTPFTDANDLNTLALFQGVGRHLTRFFFMNEDEYMKVGLDADYPYPLVNYSGFLSLLRIIMPLESIERQWTKRSLSEDELRDTVATRGLVEMDRTFSAQEYLNANIDVATSGMNAVIHYCLFGFNEGRIQKPAPVKRRATIFGRILDQ